MKRVSLIFLLFIPLIAPSVNASEQDKDMPEQPAVLARSEYKDVEFNIVKAEIVDTEPSIFSSPEATQMKLDGYLFIAIEIKNNNKKAKHYKTSWGGGGRISLDDNLGAHYYRLNTKDSVDEGLLVYPGESAELIFTFQKPSPNIEYLTLSISKYSLFRRQELSLEANEDPYVKVKLPADKVTFRKKEERPYYDILFGEEYEEDGLVIEVKRAQLGRWAKMVPIRPGRPPILIETPSFIEGNYVKKKKSEEVKIKTERVSMLCIFYKFENRTETKKIVLVGDFGFSLTDNYENKYKLLPKPEDYPESEAEVKPGHFPSIYPEESYSNVVFFEPPVKTAEYLILTIDASNTGIKDRIRVKIPSDKIKK